MKDMQDDEEFHDHDNDEYESEKQAIEEKRRYKIAKYGPGIFLYFDMQEKLLQAFAYIGVIGLVMMYIYSNMQGLHYMGDN
jgi:hypothetical protein